MDAGVPAQTLAADVLEERVPLTARGPGRAFGPPLVSSGPGRSVGHAYKIGKAIRDGETFGPGSEALAPDVAVRSDQRPTPSPPVPGGPPPNPLVQIAMTPQRASEPPNVAGTSAAPR